MHCRAVLLLPFPRAASVVLEQVFKVRAWGASARHIGAARHIERQLAWIALRPIWIPSAAWCSKRGHAVPVVQREAISRRRCTLIAMGRRKRRRAWRGNAGSVTETVAGCLQRVGGEMCAVVSSNVRRGCTRSRLCVGGCVVPGWQIG